MNSESYKNLVDIKNFLTEDILKLMYILDDYFSQNEIYLSFGHSLSHLCSGLLQIKNLKITDTDLKKELIISWIFHDLGRDLSNFSDQENHSNYSIIIFEKFNKAIDLNMQSKVKIENAIRCHSNPNISNIDFLSALLYLVDTIVLFDTIVFSPHVLDRIIITKIGEVYYDTVANRLVRTKGFGGKDSSASSQLEKKISKDKRNIKEILNKFPNLKIPVNDSLSNLNNIYNAYFTKRGKLTILLNKIKDHFHIFKSSFMLSFFIKGEFTPFIFACVIYDDCKLQRNIKNFFGFKANYCYLQEMLSKNSYDNIYFRRIIENI